MSVVIICKNEADIIDITLQSLEGLTDDIVIYDNGSTDNTIEEAKKFKINLQRGEWEGFGKTKNKAIAHAKYDWILNLDADEGLSPALKEELMQLQPDDPSIVYKFPFRNFLGNKAIKHGDWGIDHHIRLFNRNTVRWNEAAVHEQLILPGNVIIRDINNFILHHTWRNMADYQNKVKRYAQLGAEKYFQQGKRATWMKRNLSPVFNFISGYVFKLGFLDGKAGYQVARMNAHYTFLKYAELKKLSKK